MSVSVTVDGDVLDEERVRLRDGDNEGLAALSGSADGSGSEGGITIDDPDKTMILRGWEEVVVEESDCPQPRIAMGYMGDRAYSHGKYPPGLGRQIDCTIYDENVLLSMRLIDGTDGKRPVETRQARIDWLLRTYLSGIVFDVGWLTIAQTTLAVADYRGQYPAAVLDDIVSASEIYFARWDPASGKVGLFLDYATSTINTSILTISNDMADVGADPNCFYPNLDTVHTLDPSEVYDKVRLVWAHGITQNVNLTTRSTFFGNSLGTRGLNVDQSRIGASATATREVNGILTRDSEEMSTIVTTVNLPSTVVGYVLEGDRIAVKFTHFDGFDDFTYMRVMSRSLAPVQGDKTQYAVSLVLTNRGRAGGGGGGGTGTGVLPNPPPIPSPETVMTVASGTDVSDHSITVALGDIIYFKKFTTNVVWLGTSNWDWWLDSAAATAPFALSTSKILTTVNGFGTFGTSNGSWTSPDAEAEVGAHFNLTSIQAGQRGPFRPDPSLGGAWLGYKETVAAYTVGPNDAADRFHILPGTYYLRMGNDGGGDNYFPGSGYTAQLTVAVSKASPGAFRILGHGCGRADAETGAAGPARSPDVQRRRPGLHLHHGQPVRRRLPRGPRRQSRPDGRRHVL